MTQLVARVDDDLVARVDALVANGALESRSEAVRRGLRHVVEEHRRAQVGAAIVRGYVERPQTDEESTWSDEATVKMIEDEPW